MVVFAKSNVTLFFFFNYEPYLKLDLRVFECFSTKVLVFIVSFYVLKYIVLILRTFIWAGVFLMEVS